MERTWMPKAAGVLNIIAGAYILVGGIAVATTSGTPMAINVSRYYTYSIGSSATLTPSTVTIIISILYASLIILGIVSVLGGIYALKRSLWGLPLAGAILTLFYLPPLGIPAVIFTVLSKKEFA